ncbi:MAG: biotin-dependent carboxyltransferase family protein [Flavobacteriaceae bacterium]|nr:biotin-dependent carboxyltransferase family protein [Flavobacteriaceae bacterium]
MVKVINAGFYSTIQDLGRFGFQKYGVPVSGTMDNYSARIANALLGNKENEAVLEITMSGPILKFCSDTAICIAGADFSPKLNNNPIMLNHAICVKENDVLSFGNPKYGFRCYLAVSGGFQTEIIMNSRSMYKEVSTGFTLVENDELSILEHSVSIEKKNASIRIDSNHFATKKLEVFKGPEFDLLTKNQQQQLLSEEFRVSKDNNRMAYQLAETLKNTLKPIITSLVLPGTVQLTPSGKLMVLMRDCQTTGGYPRVLQLSESAINILAQKFTGNTIHFKMID